MIDHKSPARSVTEVRIVEAAAQQFARCGFKAATTREIAELAGVNEVTLYRYFRRKSDVFWAAMESRLSRVKLGRVLQTDLAADEPPERVVPQLVAFLLQCLTQEPQLPRLVYVAVFELPQADKIIVEHLGPIFDVVNGYFGRCVQRDMIPKIDASLVTSGIFGSVVVASSLTSVFEGCGSLPHGLEEESAAWAALWLRVLAPSYAAKDIAPTGA